MTFERMSETSECLGKHSMFSAHIQCTAASTAFPQTRNQLIALNKSIRIDRGNNESWRQISEKTGLTRVEAIRIAHSPVEIADQIRMTQV